MGKKHSDKTKNNLPKYINNGGKIEIDNLSKKYDLKIYEKPKPIPKFQLGIDKNNNPNKEQKEFIYKSSFEIYRRLF